MPAPSSENAPGKPRPDETRARGPRLRVSSPVSLLAAVPLLLKFQPAEHDIVVIGTEPGSRQVRVTLRYDMPGPRQPRLATALARDAVSLLDAQGTRTAAAAGYGTNAEVSPVAAALRECAAGAGIAIAELLRVADGRYWSYVCTDPECCPPEGTPFNLEDHPVTRQYGGQVLASRQDLAATIAPVTGEAAGAVRRAARAARQHAARLAGTAAPGTAPRRALLEPGLKAVADAIGLYRSGGKLESYQDAAWLALVLKDLPVRDDACARILPGDLEAHRRLWTDLTTLAPRGDAAAPATLLALAAWQDGNGALANIALDRALADNPRYRMAHLIRDALDSGAPPSQARPPMTPQEVAASYGHGKDPGASEASGKGSPQEPGSGNCRTAGGQAPAAEPGRHADQRGNLPSRPPRGQSPATGRRRPQNPGPEPP